MVSPWPVVANVAAGPESRRVPERMAERVAGIGPWHAEHEQALVSAIGDDDPRRAGGPIPLERDRETGVMARVEFREHDWLLPGFGHLRHQACASRSAVASVSFPGPSRGWSGRTPGPVNNPVSKPGVLDGGDARTRPAGCVASPHH